MLGHNEGSYVIIIHRYLLMVKIKYVIQLFLGCLLIFLCDSILFFIFQPLISNICQIIQTPLTGLICINLLTLISVSIVFFVFCFLFEKKKIFLWSVIFYIVYDYLSLLLCLTSFSFNVILMTSIRCLITLICAVLLTLWLIKLGKK